MQIFISVLLGALGGGLLSFIQFLITRKDKKEDMTSDLLDAIADLKQELQNTKKHMEDEEKESKILADLVRGTAYDRICFVGRQYLEKGEIDFDERENFRKYLYNPYHAAGGDGTAEKIMEQIDKLPLREH